MQAIQPVIDQWGQPLVHLAGQILFEIRQKDAILHALSKIEQRVRDATAPRVPGAIRNDIVTNDVLHGNLPPRPVSSRVYPLRGSVVGTRCQNRPR
jgi:hypothetical protein